MKKHLFEPLIFLVAFLIGFLASPVRFTVFAVGSGLHGGFTSYQSTYFVRVACEREPYEEWENIDQAFQERVNLYSEYVENQQVLELSENRAVITFRADYSGQSYCIIRKKKRMLYNICSSSLWHAVEFEKQKFREN
jgi:hypothetical protein